MYAVRWRESKDKQAASRFLLELPTACGEPSCSAYYCPSEWPPAGLRHPRHVVVHCEVYHQGTNLSTGMFEINTLQYFHSQHYSKTLYKFDNLIQLLIKPL
ncbi:hypothetical protein NPIL_567461 [Nephila pilipes]|uniref:Uncharacterized protein n=1 Tax=Nephila pilipes TaxID=299642 RepID=A0A8X6PIE5_NEPPI|nr:hypothetical protein NPIL_567461 [Nephila pilipes]